MWSVTLSQLVSTILLGSSLSLSSGTISENDVSEIVVENNTPHFELGATYRQSWFIKSWITDNPKARSNMALDTFFFDVDGESGPWSTSIQYRFYESYNLLRYGYVNYDLGAGEYLRAGVDQKPFGILGYASHSWFFDLPFYVGLEDDKEAGILYAKSDGDDDFRLAYFFSGEGNWNGSSRDSTRYSYDVSSAGPDEIPGLNGVRQNSEKNQINARYAKTLRHGDSGTTKLGLSLEYGGVKNGTTGRMGSHTSFAAHANGNYGAWNVQLQAIKYEYDLRNPIGQDDNFVVLGAYDYPYKVAAKGTVLNANVAKTYSYESGSIDSITFYSDYSHIFKDFSGYADTQQLVIGAMILSGQTTTFVDFGFGRNHPWIGPGYTSALAEGDGTGNWHFRFNVNVAFKF